jgi:uncharacterized protein
MKTAKKILITGGTGMIGKRLTTHLIQNGYKVAHLSRKKKRTSDVQTFLWNPYKKEIENGALKDVDAIIHLAGAGIADRRWTEKWKKEILASRTETTRFLKEMLSTEQNRVTTFISSSGISYYGLQDPGRAFVESDVPGTDFMAEVTIEWEAEADRLSVNGTRVAKIRTGVVLSRDSVALKRLAMPVKFFVGAPIGSGKQYFNWIHIDDLCGIYMKAIEDAAISGAYNAVAPHPVTNRLLTRKIADVLNRPLWLPPVPAFIVRIIAGQVAEVVLNGGMISSEKIKSCGFTFQFKTIESALADIFKRQESIEA